MQNRDEDTKLKLLSMQMLRFCYVLMMTSNINIKRVFFAMNNKTNLQQWLTLNCEFFLS